MGERVGLHDQPSTVLVKPAAAIASPHVHKIHRSVMLRGPVAVLDLVFGGVHEDDAAGPEYRHHAPILDADIPIDVVAMAVGEHAFKMTPFFYHAGQ